MWGRGGAMGNLTDRLESKARTEIRYARGMEVMQRERYVEYCHDLRRARMRGDFARMREIIQDLSAFTSEMRALTRAHQRAFERLFIIRHGQDFTPEPDTDLTAPPPRPRSRGG